MRNLVFVFLVLASFMGRSLGQTIVGNEIHNFSLPDLNGTFHSPSQYRGKVLGIFLLGYD